MEPSTSSRPSLSWDLCGPGFPYQNSQARAWSPSTPSSTCLGGKSDVKASTSQWISMATRSKSQTPQSQTSRRVEYRRGGTAPLRLEKSRGIFVRWKGNENLIQLFLSYYYCTVQTHASTFTIAGARQSAEQTPLIADSNPADFRPGFSGRDTKVRHPPDTLQPLTRSSLPGRKAEARTEVRRIEEELRNRYDQQTSFNSVVCESSQLNVGNDE